MAEDRLHLKLLECGSSFAEEPDFLIVDASADAKRIMVGEEAIYCQVADKLTGQIFVKSVNAYPDMAAALEYVIGFIETLEPDCMGVGGDGHKTHWYIRDEWLAKARAAIEK